MAQKRIELATAYMPVMPSFRGIKGSLEKQLGQAFNNTAATKMAQKFTKTFQAEVAKANVQLPGPTKATLGKMKSAFLSAVPNATEISKKMNTGGPVVIQTRYDSKGLANAIKQTQAQVKKAAPVFGPQPATQAQQVRLLNQQRAQMLKSQKADAAAAQADEAKLQAIRARNAAQINSILAGASRLLGKGLLSVAKFFGQNMLSISSRFIYNITRGLASAATSFGRSLISASTGAVGIISAGVASALAVGAGGGLSQALDLNDAEARLAGMKKNVEGVTATIKGLQSDGNPFGIADLMSNATKLLGAGVKEGKELASIVDVASRASLQSGAELKDITFVFGQIASVGHAQLQDIYQLTERNIPVLQYLEEKLGKSRREILEMISARKISSKKVFDAMSDSLASMQKILDISLRANLMVFKNKYNTLFATIWTPLVKDLVPIVQTVNSILDELIKRLEDSFGQSGFRNVMKQFVAQINTFLNSITVDEITAFFTKADDAIQSFYNSTRNIQGPIIGIMVGIVGALASRIPIIGGLFAGITPLVGLFAGALLQSYRASDQLKGSISRAWEAIKELGTALLGAFVGDGSDPLKTFGDKLAGGVNRITQFIRKMTKRVSGLTTGDLGKKIGSFFSRLLSNVFDFINRLVERWPDIKAAFSGVFDAIADAFESDSKKSAGKSFADFLVSFIQLFSEVLQSIIPVVASVVRTTAKIVESGVIQKAISWIVDAAGYVIEHKAILYTLIGVLSAWFIGKKLSGPILAMLRFAGKLPRASKGAGIASSFKTLGIIIASVAAIAGAIKLIGVGLNVGGFESYLTGLDALRFFAETVVDIIADIINSFSLAEGGFIALAAIFAKLFTSMGKKGASKSIEGGSKGFAASMKGVLKWVTAGLGLLSGVIIIITTLGNTINLDPNGIANLTTGLEAIRAFFATLVDILADIISTAQGLVGNGIASVGKGIAEVFNALPLGTLGTFTEMLAKNGMAAGSGASALGKGFIDLAAGLAALTASSIGGDKIQELSQNPFRFGAIGSVVDAGKKIYSGIKGGVAEQATRDPSILQPLFDLLGPALAELSRYVDQVNVFGSDLAIGILRGFESSAEQMKNGIYAIIDELMEGINNRFSTSIDLAIANSKLTGAGQSAVTSLNTTNNLNYTAVYNNAENNRILERGIAGRL